MTPTPAHASYGCAAMGTDGEDEHQFLAGIASEGATFPLAHNRLSDDELAGACFSPDRRTMFRQHPGTGADALDLGPWTR